MNKSDKIKLVLLPGLDGTGELFEPFVANLPSNFDSCIISYPLNERMSIEDLANLVESKLPKERFVLLAESYSGLVAMKLIPKISSQLMGVFFVGTFVSSPRPILLPISLTFSFLYRFTAFIPNFALRVFCLGWPATSEQCQWLRNVLTKVPSETIIFRLKQIKQFQLNESIDIPYPSFYIQGQNDFLVPNSATQKFAKNVLGLQILKLNTSHFILQAKPLESALLVSEYCRNLYKSN